MTQNKYYTPDQGDFYIGYAFEIFEDFDYYPEKSWHKFTYGPEDGTDNVENMQCPMSRPFKDWEGHIRTKSLDRGDIESLGWVLSDRRESTDDRMWFYKIEVTDEGTDEEYDLRHNLLLINSEWGITVVINLEMAPGHFKNGFDGSCPSINELRTIQKLLGI